jgi:hypothetical protein
MKISSYVTGFVLASIVSGLSIAQSIVYEVRALNAASSTLLAGGTIKYKKEDLIRTDYNANGKSVSERLIPLTLGFKVGARIFFEAELSGLGLVAK